MGSFPQDPCQRLLPFVPNLLRVFFSFYRQTGPRGPGGGGGAERRDPASSDGTPAHKNPGPPTTTRRRACERVRVCACVRVCVARGPPRPRLPGLPVSGYIPVRPLFHIAGTRMYHAGSLYPFRSPGLLDECPHPPPPDRPCRARCGPSPVPAAVGPRPAEVPYPDAGRGAARCAAALPRGACRVAVDIHY